MHYLNIGISIVFLTALASCKVDDKNLSPIRYKINYVNETVSKIKYYQYTSTQRQIFIFEIEPKATYTIEAEGEYDKSEDYPFACCYGFFLDLQDRGDILVAFDNNQCLIFESGTGPTTENLEGYDYQINDEGVNEFTYTLTDNDLAMAEDCD